MGGEIDVCVDFVAPAKPGRYISYWRLTSPDLLKFGQGIWVLIQVFTWPLFVLALLCLGTSFLTIVCILKPCAGGTACSNPWQE